MRAATSTRSLRFSCSSRAARMAISSSFALRASLERLAASLFFRRLSQYASSFWLSGSVRGRFRLPPEEMELVEDTKGGAVGVGKGEEMGVELGTWLWLWLWL